MKKKLLVLAVAGLAMMSSAAMAVQTECNAAVTAAAKDVSFATPDAYDLVKARIATMKSDVDHQLPACANAKEFEIAFQAENAKLVAARK